MSADSTGITWPAVFRAALPALAIAVFAAWVLRFTGLPVGFRTGAAMFLLIVIYNYFFERTSGYRRTGPQWMGAIAIAAAGALAVGYLAGR
jgi:hypothetical protein